MQHRRHRRRVPILALVGILAVMALPSAALAHERRTVAGGK
jgi:hypothetical protein